MNNTTYTGRSLEDLKTSKRLVTRKMDELTQEAAIITGILPVKPGRKFWCVTEINWEDSRLTAIRKTYFELAKKAANLETAIAKLEDNLQRHEARKKANHFLSTSFTSFEDAAKWLKKNNLNGLSLAEKILENPNFLSEVEL